MSLRSELAACFQLAEQLPVELAEPDEVCGVEFCDLPVLCRSMCDKHYTRLRRHGDVNNAGAFVRSGPELIDYLADRFRIDDQGCWVWTAGVNRGTGYGSTWRRQLAHRVAYLEVVGPIPDGLQLDHLCRNRACINPDHLEPVTIGENVLRGVGITAVNARKTHCKRGHPFSGDNLRLTPTGGRVCMTCRRMWTARTTEKARVARVGRPRARKSHCKYGHEFTPENTYVMPSSGYRTCRECQRRRDREQYQRERGKA